jgi:hypothetical protein
MFEHTFDLINPVRRVRLGHAAPIGRKSLAACQSGPVTHQRMIAMAAALATATLLASCAAPFGPPRGTEAASLAEYVEEQLSAVPGVESVDVVQDPLAGTSTEADRWNPDLFQIRIAVTLAADATPELAVVAADATHAFSKEHSGGGLWFAELAVGEPTHDADLDMVIPNPVRVEVFPEVWRSPSEDVAAAMEARTIPGIRTVAILGGWPSLATINAMELADAHADVHELELFASGGSYNTMDGHLRVIALPHRVSPATLVTIIQLAAAYPQADVALESPLQGEQWPQLYLNRVTADEATAITATLTARSLAADRVENYAVPYFMRVHGPDGQSDVSGLIGG